ncbi:hypothetical protein M9H77_14001 [Catharanthus roseus]|uniref:Uncharacterized protein n=1 Tax=Catharanthus roseus TaxID=4058 RepID=A0ACC0BM00_CATRO|nr:hypothetical protein M9H77_14001 [Catharanthus roseus]
MPCLKDKPISDSPLSVPTPSSIPVEVEVTSEPSLDSPLEPETSVKLPASSSSTPDHPSILETLDPVLEGSDEEEEHHEAQAQAVKDYQLARDRPGLPIATLDLFMFSLPPQFQRHSRLFLSSLFFCSFSAFQTAVSVSSSSPLLYRGLPCLLLSSSDLRVPLIDSWFIFLSTVIVLNFGLDDWLELAVK